jgi:hypothetical protein
MAFWELVIPLILQASKVAQMSQATLLPAGHVTVPNVWKLAGE